MGSQGVTRKGAAIALLLAALSVGPAWSAPQSYCATYDLPPRYETRQLYEPMQYRLMEAGGQRILVAEGAIKAGEAERLTSALQTYRPIDEVWFNSPGGAAVEGTKMGRILRQLGLAVRLKEYHSCVSACSYAFLGGAVREVEPGAYYGIHMFRTQDQETYQRLYDAGSLLSAELSHAQNSAQSAREKVRQEANRRYTEKVDNILFDWQQDAAQLAAIRARYLIEMSLSLDFLTDAFGTRAADVCYLSQSGLTHYNVDNTP